MNVGNGCGGPSVAVLVGSCSSLHTSCSSLHTVQVPLSADVVVMRKNRLVLTSLADGLYTYELDPCNYPAPWWGLFITRPGGGGAFFRPPPRISETTGRISKIQTAFESPVKFVEGNPISLTSGSPMTAQVRSKIKCFAGHGSSRKCVITSSKTHFIENQR